MITKIKEGLSILFFVLAIIFAIIWILEFPLAIGDWWNNANKDLIDCYELPKKCH